MTQRIDRPPWLPADDLDRVTVSATARFHGLGPQLLPSRMDARGVIGAVLVEEEADARTVFRALDIPGRTIYVDVERKQRADLMAIARDEVRTSALAHTKPNDATVDALDVTVSHFLGPDLHGLTAGIVGVGNLGFKSALRLAERNARVRISDRDPQVVRRATEAINGILPRYQSDPVDEWRHESVDLLITAVTSVSAIDATWLTRVASGALVIDMGINNLSEEFIAGALARDLRLVRLDTRASTQHIPEASPGFFEEYLGESTLGETLLISGGVMGRYGQVVVDSFAHPTVVVGIANGHGGLVPLGELTAEEKGLVASVENHIRAAQAGA